MNTKLFLLISILCWFSISVNAQFDPNIVPAASAFTVQVNGINRMVNSVAISGNKVQLTLASPIVLAML